VKENLNIRLNQLTEQRRAENEIISNLQKNLVYNADKLRIYIVGIDHAIFKEEGR
jgi:hypothetical protein